MKAIHNEGAVGAGPAKLIAVYMVEKGQPLVNPVAILYFTNPPQKIWSWPESW